MANISQMHRDLLQGEFPMRDANEIEIIWRGLRKMMHELNYDGLDGLIKKIWAVCPEVDYE